MTIVSANRVAKIRELSENIKGSSEYNKYYMETHIKTDGRWRFAGWYVPTELCDAMLKTVKDKTYLVFSDTRYVMQDIHYEILGL